MAMARRATRQNSNVFNMLTKQQIIQLREAFNLLDVDADSHLSATDMRTFLESIGSPFSDEEINSMLDELAPNPNFVMLLTVIGERLAEISPESEIVSALQLFDDKGDGLIEKDLLKRWMVESGEGLSEMDFKYLVRGCEEDGQISVRKLARKMKYGEVVEENVLHGE